MGGIKRLCLTVFGLCGVLCLCALALPWVGPFREQATALLDNYYYWTALQVVFCVTALGVIVTLLRGLFTPRQRKTVVINRSGHDQITVTTAAIQSQASHVVESDGRFVAERVRVGAKKRGGVNVDLRIRPRHTVNLTQEGSRIHDELISGLSTICGDKVNRVNIEFLEAEQPIEVEPTYEDVESLDGGQAPLQIPQSVYDRLSQKEDEGEGGITVPMGQTDTTASDSSANAEGEV